MRWVAAMFCRLEDGLLVALLAIVIVLSTTQIGLRGLFNAGLVWVDPLLRVLVLWLGLTGASVASRANNHIKIDLISRYFSRRGNLIIQAVTCLFTGLVCVILAWHGGRWVRLEYLDGMRGFAGSPAWLLESIVPLAFALIGLRYVLATCAISGYFWRRGRRRGGLRK